MALSEDLINFDLIETHKENIQQLPGGRSARQLVSILSPLSSAKTGIAPTFDETKTLNDAIRQEYENELAAIADSDDPLDIFDRYVKWTLNAYPSAQATPQSQLLPLLERATKSFLTSAHYKNDPRYLKLWLHYIRLFSDTPRETFAFLARHHIGESLGLFYEEFAAWLEGAGRWNQADEVFKLGIEKEARPTERLMRKYNQFQQRHHARPASADEPSSPALPTVRPALAAKIDPFASAMRSEDPQAQRADSGGNSGKSKSGRPKMAIFSDAANETPPSAASTTKGWDSIGSMKERKKENTIEARPWTGETLKAGKRVGTVPKMEVFKDTNTQFQESIRHSLAAPANVVNPKTGRAERVFVNLQAVYPSTNEEYSFEELRALSRGWLGRDWSAAHHSVPNSGSSKQGSKSLDNADIENLSHSFQQKLDVHDTSTRSMADALPETKPAKQRRTKIREVKQETQTVKTRLDSPTGRKIKRKVTAEPTMTLHSKAATNEIYDIFNQPRRAPAREDTQSGDDTDYYGDDTYSTAGKSVNTGIISGNNSEFEDDTTRSFGGDVTGSQPGSVSPWSDFTTSKHVPDMNRKSMRARSDSEGSTNNQTMQTGAFDTMAISALANQNFDDLDTQMIAQLAGDIVGEEDARKVEDIEDATHDHLNIEMKATSQAAEEELKTPIEEPLEQLEMIEERQTTKYIPLPPVDYEPTPMRPYRDINAVGHNKMPFMTPIAERTESSFPPPTDAHISFDMAKIPSRSAIVEQSPSKLQIDELLIDSPQSKNAIAIKRQRQADDRILDTDEDSGSPPKRQVTHSPAVADGPVPFPVTRQSAVGNITEAVPVECIFKPAPAINLDTSQSKPVMVSSKKFLPAKAVTVRKGPIILENMCNPVDPVVQQQILDQVQPSPSTYQGYHEYNTTFGQLDALKKYARKLKAAGSSPRKSPRKPLGDRNASKSSGPELSFDGTDRIYAVKKELGEGAFAAVYLVESHDAATVSTTHEADDPDKPQPKGTERNALEAMKSENPASSLAWEFHLLHLLKSRLGVGDRAIESIVTAHECHLYRDECYLILDYHSQGTILDLVNKVRTDNSRAGKAVEGLDETVAMWLSVEMLRTMEAFHKVGILHGDLKIDNCLARFEPHIELISPYNKHGEDGWASKGLMLIDFGRGIDVKAFKPDARFVADWKAEETDCPEIREARPWKWEIDLYGAAGIIHSLLFGKYIETVASGGGELGQKKEWKLKDSFKRYWEREIWTEVFHVLLNSGGRTASDNAKEVSRIRNLMEDWLEKESERGGRDLRGAIRRCERLVGITGSSRSTSRGRGQ